MSISVEWEGLDEFQRVMRQASDAVRREVDKALRSASLKAVGKARELAPVRTGALRRSIRSERHGIWSYHVGSDVEYASFMELGTKAHIIRQGKGEALHFVTRQGKDVFAEEVHHPGTKPYRFLKQGMEYAKQYLEETLLNVLRGVFKK